jgi:hypothetical protein
VSDTNTNTCSTQTYLIQLVFVFYSFTQPLLVLNTTPLLKNSLSLQLTSLSPSRTPQELPTTPLYMPFKFKNYKHDNFEKPPYDSPSLPLTTPSTLHDPSIFKRTQRPTGGNQRTCTRFICCTSFLINLYYCCNP